MKNHYCLSLFYTFNSIHLSNLYLENLLPVADAEIRNTLQNIYLKNFGLSLTIIAFYIFPFLFLKR